MARVGLPTPSAHGYDTRSGKWKDVTRRNGSAAWASGGLISTAADVGRFFTALFTVQLVPPALLAQMEGGVDTHDNQGGPDLSGLGLEGQLFACGRAWGHYDNLYGFSGSAMATPTGSQIVVLLTNADQSLSISDAPATHSAKRLSMASARASTNARVSSCARA
jgi:D-alanyl-D-alanine carboxypeptidase